MEAHKIKSLIVDWVVTRWMLILENITSMFASKNYKGRVSRKLCILCNIGAVGMAPSKVSANGSHNLDKL